MADKEQLEILKQGVEIWNRWREENPDAEIDLSMANLGMPRLRGANLKNANFVGADLSGTEFRFADLSRAVFLDSNLNGVDFYLANLTEGDFKGANLSEADLWRAELREADLKYANLRGANLDETNLEGAILGYTDLGDVNLSRAIGLEKVVHRGTSTIGTDTIRDSKGRIPDKFLRGCGLSDWEIESAKLYQPDLSAKEIEDILSRVHGLRTAQAIQISSLFISYSHKDSTFVTMMEGYLNRKGVRFWRDIHDATVGRLEKVVEHAMRQSSTVLLVLSENSVQSDWVEHEARVARELEKKLKRDMLCPVALDSTWKNCRWSERLREQIMEYNILDFSSWKDEKEFGKMFKKLIEGLDLFYKE